MSLWQNLRFPQSHQLIPAHQYTQDLGIYIHRRGHQASWLLSAILRRERRGRKFVENSRMESNGIIHSVRSQDILCTRNGVLLILTNGWSVMTQDLNAAKWGRSRLIKSQIMVYCSSYWDTHKEAYAGRQCRTMWRLIFFFSKDLPLNASKVSGNIEVKRIDSRISSKTQELTRRNIL
jgi:hypothetical protein